jgi:demethylspheroidene O-methyltransferase
VNLIAPLQDRWRDLRNRLLASPGFQDFAVRFPLTRPISRKRSKDLFDLLAGFAYSQVFFATVRLNLFDMLRNGALATPEIARRIGWPADKTERLLKAAAAIGLVERASGGSYGLGIHGAALLGNPWIARFIEHHHLLYADLADPLALLRGDVAKPALQGYWAYAGSDAPEAAAPEATHAYTQLMAASQMGVAKEVLAAYDFSPHRHLMDVGGSNGTFLTQVAAKHRQLGLTLFDLPGVVAHARDSQAVRALGSRIALETGSFLSDPLPRGADIVTLVRILHDHDDESVLKLLGAIRSALPPEGVLLVAEPLSGEPATAAVTDAYFNLYFAAMGQGRTRSVAEIGRLGRAAGFAQIRAICTRMPLITGLAVLSN